MVIEICWFLLLLGAAIETCALARIARHISKHRLNEPWEIEEFGGYDNDRKKT